VNYLLLKNIEVSGIQVSDYRKRTPDLMAKCIDEIFTLFEAGKLKPSPTATYPLEQFTQAMQDIANRRVRRRIVLVQDP
jgi:NADPH2:quinone reductase